MQKNYSPVAEIRSANLLFRVIQNEESTKRRKNKFKRNPEEKRSLFAAKYLDDKISPGYKHEKTSRAHVIPSITNPKGGVKKIKSPKKESIKSKTKSER